MGRWTVCGYDGLELIFEGEMPGTISDNQMKVILQRLVCRHLNEKEILAASLHVRHASHAPLLEVGFTRSETRPGYTCGDNPHYVAFKIPSPKRGPRSGPRPHLHPQGF